MTVTINGSSGITAPEVTLDNTTADGGQVVLKSSGYSNWNLDNYSGRFRAYYNSTEYFTVTNSGNVGIGTSSPAQKLSVNGSILATQGNKVGVARSDGALVSYIANVADNETQWRSDGGGAFSTFYTAGSERARIDSSGNVGINLTPATQYSTVRGLGIAGTNGNPFYVTSGAGQDGVLTSNAYLNASANFTYVNTDAVVQQRMSSGIVSWWNAPSGTAGTTATMTERARIDSSGNLLVGTTNANANAGAGVKLINSGAVYVVNASGDSFDYYNSTSGSYRFYVASSGQIYSTSTTISAISDERLKENIRDLDTGINSVMALKPRRFDWKEGKGQDKKDVAGFIAQEFEEVFPECVGTTKAGEDGIEYKNISHETLIPTMVKAIQEQQAIITSLTARIEALENK